MEKTTTHRKKQFVSNAFKYMIAVSSIAGTLGIWNLLANKDLVNANAQTSTNGQTSAINQAPLPTLVPAIKVDLNKISTGTGLTTAAVPLREVAVPTAAPAASSSSALPSVTSNNQSSPVVLPPAPVTTTQSSRK
jgi:hypothetical protein